MLCLRARKPKRSNVTFALQFEVTSMSNNSIIQNIRVLIDQLNGGELDLEDFYLQFNSHAEALEGVDYSLLYEARTITHEAYFASQGYNPQALTEQELASDLVRWGQSWLEKIPVEPSQPSE